MIITEFANFTNAKFQFGKKEAVCSKCRKQDRFEINHHAASNYKLVLVQLKNHKLVEYM